LKEFDTADEDISFLRDVKGGHKVIPELESLFPCLKIKLDLSSQIDPYLNLNLLLKKIKFKLPLKLDKFLILMLSSHPVPLVWILLLFLSSTLFKSPLKFRKDKLKSQKIIKCAKLEKKLEIPK